MSDKSFAFKLAQKRSFGDGKWKARDGLALAACTELANGNYRSDERTFPGGPPGPPDSGFYC
jgi:hypothetical protein